jgi:colicin import membrane protein
MAENQLQVIVKESGLEPTKARYILEQFQDYFQIASEWEIKAKALIVTNEKQTAEMEMARTGRLFLKEKRIAVEKARKELKEQSLREGKAIDGIANVLKALIVPIEEHLERQEKFIEIKEEAKRLEIEARIAEEERIAQEKAAAEQERLRVENEKLKAEALKKEKALMAERKKQEAILAEERAKAEAGRKAIEEKARFEREKQAKMLAEQKAKSDKEKAEQERIMAVERAKVEAEKKKAAEKARKEQELAQAKLDAECKEKERLEEMLKNQVTCPKCGHKFQPNKEKK